MSSLCTLVSDGYLIIMVFSFAAYASAAAEIYSQDWEEDGTIQWGHPGGDHRAWTRACIYRWGKFASVNTKMVNILRIYSLWNWVKHHCTLSGQNGPAAADDPECRSHRQPVRQRWVTPTGRWTEFRVWINKVNVNETSTKAGAVCLRERGLLLSTDVFWFFFFLQVPVIRWAPSSTRSWRI